MKTRSASKTVPGLLLLSFATLVLAQPAAALDADYWRGGWRTPLGDEPHIYEFVIRGSRVTGVYCRNCSDATHDWLHRRHVGREGRHRLHGHVRQPGRQHQVC